MPPTVPTEEIPVNSSTSLSSSRKWLVQVALLFGLLGLGRWSRYLSGQLLANREGAPRTMFKPDEGQAYWDEQKAREAKRETAKSDRKNSDDG